MIGTPEVFQPTACETGNLLRNVIHEIFKKKDIAVYPNNRLLFGMTQQLAGPQNAGKALSALNLSFFLGAVTSEGRPGSDHIAHWDGNAVQHRAQLALAGEDPNLDIAIRLLFGSHARG